MNHALFVLGLPGLVGIGLLLFALGLYDSSVAPARAKAAALDSRVTQLHKPPSAVAGAGMGPLADFYSFFPPTDALPEGLEKVYALAAAEGLDLPHGEYRLVEDPRRKLVAYEASFQIQGDYGQLRRFLAAVLNDLPYASLNDLKFNRQRSSAPAIDAVLKLTLYLRTP